MHSGLKNHKYGRDTRGSHMADELEYGIKVIYRSGEKTTKWYASQRLRDRALPFERAESRVKSAKPYERKKK